ncbi:hypothetical protein MMC22_000503 [Lobaria immixta]|nr:hypothetical protein [Lobaria immixta]
MDAGRWTRAAAKNSAIDHVINSDAQHLGQTVLLALRRREKAPGLYRLKTSTGQRCKIMAVPSIWAKQYRLRSVDTGKSQAGSAITPSKFPRLGKGGVWYLDETIPLALRQYYQSKQIKPVLEQELNLAIKWRRPIIGPTITARAQGM